MSTSGAHDGSGGDSEDNILILLSWEIEKIDNVDTITYISQSASSNQTISELFRCIHCIHHYRVGICCLICEWEQDMSPGIQWYALWPSKQSSQKTQKNPKAPAVILYGMQIILFKGCSASGQNIFDLFLTWC